MTEHQYESCPPTCCTQRRKKKSLTAWEGLWTTHSKVSPFFLRMKDKITWCQGCHSYHGNTAFSGMTSEQMSIYRNTFEHIKHAHTMSMKQVPLEMALLANHWIPVAQSMTSHKFTHLMYLSPTQCGLGWQQLQCTKGSRGDIKWNELKHKNSNWMTQFVMF